MLIWSAAVPDPALQDGERSPPSPDHSSPFKGLPETFPFATIEAPPGELVEIGISWACLKTFLRGIGTRLRCDALDLGAVHDFSANGQESFRIYSADLSPTLHGQKGIRVAKIFSCFSLFIRLKSQGSGVGEILPGQQAARKDGRSTTWHSHVGKSKFSISW